MKTKQPSHPARRRLAGFFQIPPDATGPEAERAWIKGVLDAMERVDREDAAAHKGKKARAEQGHGRQPGSRS